MVFSGQMQIAAALGMILGLIAIGTLICLGSGEVSLSSRPGMHLFLANLSRYVIRLLAYLAAFLAIQEFIGAPLQFNW